MVTSDGPPLDLSVLAATVGEPRVYFADADRIIADAEADRLARQLAAANCRILALERRLAEYGAHMARVDPDFRPGES